VYEKDKVKAAERPIKRMFDLPRDAKFARILHLIRESKSDHNAAILVAENLDALTDQVQADGSTCRSERDRYCS
jgi:hypothetical protein